LHKLPPESSELFIGLGGSWLLGMIACPEFRMASPFQAEAKPKDKAIPSFPTGSRNSHSPDIGKWGTDRRNRIGPSGCNIAGSAPGLLSGRGSRRRRDRLPFRFSWDWNSSTPPLLYTAALNECRFGITGWLGLSDFRR
jgi:hypothetical protein